MSNKLTLSIDKDLIQRAKDFARKSNRGLSDIVASYLERITDKGTNEVDLEISQIIVVIDLPEDFDEKREVRALLAEKHL